MSYHRANGKFDLPLCMEIATRQKKKCGRRESFLFLNNKDASHVILRAASLLFDIFTITRRTERKLLPF